MTTHLAKFLDHNTFEPWDILFRNLFERDSFFLPAINIKPSYPTDIYEDEKQVTIEVAAVGLNKDDINIEQQDGILTISYNKTNECENGNIAVDTYSEESPNKCKCIQHGITRKSFNLSYKFSEKFNLENIDAELDRGILKIVVPKKEEKPALPKNTIKIK